MGNGNLPFPFPDAVSQFSVESSVLGAQDGEHTGGYVNVVTRSGTNSFHGSAFEFIRNNFIDATNFYSTSKDTLHQNQYRRHIWWPDQAQQDVCLCRLSAHKADQSQASTEAFVPTAANLAGDFSVTDGPNCEASGKFVSAGRPADRGEFARRRLSNSSHVQRASTGVAKVSASHRSRRSTQKAAGLFPTPSRPRLSTTSSLHELTTPSTRRTISTVDTSLTGIRRPLSFLQPTS